MTHCQRSISLTLLVLGSVASLCTIAMGADEGAADALTYDDHIKPILRQYCLKCHGDDTHEADLNLQSHASLLKGSSGGKVVEAGRSSQSKLLLAIINPDDDLRMPPESPPLPSEKVEVVRRWIDSGLRETATSKSMSKTRDLAFQPADSAGAKPDGPPPLPENLPTIEIPLVNRPMPILAMDASPWAPLLAVSGYEHVRLIDAQSEKELGKLAFPEGEPHVIRFSRDGALLMVAGGRPVELGKVVLFDVKTGSRVAEIGDEIDTVLAADLSPDQRFVALGGSGKVVKVHSTTDGERIYELKKHTDWITALAFSPDAALLASADRKGGIHLWDTKTGGILLNLSEHKQAVRALDWRSDSQMLASVGEDGRIIWWDVSDGFPTISRAGAHQPPRPSGIFGIIPNGVLATRFDAQGNLVTAGRDRVLRLWTPDGKEIKSHKLGGGLPISVAVSHDGKTVISGDSEGTVERWKVE